MPRTGSSLHPSQPLNILLVASEAVPFAKTGGLADVAGALPRELARLGHHVSLVLPGYSTIDASTHGLASWDRVSVPSASGPTEAIVERGLLPDSTLPLNQQAQIFAIRHDAYFSRKGLYQQSGADYPDNLERFTFFCRAVMQLLLQFQDKTQWVPDVIHAHDWQTALCLAYLKILYLDYTQRHSIGTLFTIHNLGYQGLFPASDYPKTGLPPSLFTPSGLEFYGSCNVLKSGLVYADYLSTVSQTYSREIQTPEFGFGLDGLIRERQDRLIGVVNGIDTDVWDPATDTHLPVQYSALDLSGKRECKRALQRELKLPVKDVPLLAVVSRLTAQKGLDLVMEIVPELMSLDVQLVLLGTGDASAEAQWRALQARYSSQLGLRIGFDEGLAHRIEAGADLFLMPSRYEPCGLNQLYSLRYGTVPIVRRTGGLADTVVSYTPMAVKEARATGFMFGEASAEALLNTVLLALRVYKNRLEWRGLMQTGMQIDVSWARSAHAYEDVYRRTLTYVRGSA
ncbi:MAG: glycogen synthase GlgA [Nitrospirales bacterium]|nr:glycogen synthase GlgA [Nitrospirales bacterium]